jgi:hypothetical protein
MDVVGIGRIEEKEGAKAGATVPKSYRTRGTVHEREERRCYSTPVLFT